MEGRLARYGLYHRRQPWRPQIGDRWIVHGSSHGDNIDTASTARLEKEKVRKENPPPNRKSHNGRSTGSIGFGVGYIGRGLKHLLVTP